MKLAVLALISAVSPIWGQIAQTSPQYCGIPGDVSPRLPAISASTDPTDGHTTIYFGSDGSSVAVQLLGVPLSQVKEVCPLSDGRLVIFADYGVTDVFIVDPTTASIMDSFGGFEPVISPNQRWIAYVKEFPLHGVDGSAEYLIYDLRKTAAQNRPDGDPNNGTDVGAAIFPPGAKNFPGDNIGLAQGQLHYWASRLYWAPDSRAILFVDLLKAKPRRHIVLVTLDDNGTPSASEHEVTVSELCGREIPGVDLDWRLEQPQITSSGANGPSVSLELASNDLRCPHSTLQLNKADFRPAATEVHIQQKSTRGMIKDGVVIPPPPQN